MMGKMDTRLFTTFTQIEVWTIDAFISNPNNGRLTVLTRETMIEIFFEGNCLRIVLVIGLCFLGVGGFAVGSNFAQLLPKYFPASGIFIVGVSLIVVAGLGFLACWKGNRFLLIFTTGLLLALVCSQIALAARGYQMQDTLSQQIYDSWLNSSIKVRISVEKNFNCCGWRSPLDEVPPGWDINTCPQDESKDKCCQLSSIFNTTTSNSSVLDDDTCPANSTLLACCPPPDECIDSDLVTCQNSIDDYLNHKIVLILTLVVLFALVEILGIIESVALTVRLWPRKPKASAYPRYSQL